MRIVENFKSLVLTLLILLSLVLTGSLWFDNYRGLSFVVSNLPNKIAEKFTPEEEYSKLYEELILPYKVTVINPDGNRWIAYESDEMNASAWNIVKSRLNSMNDQTEIITGRVSEWEDLINRKSIILEFGGSIEYDILKLVIPNLKGSGFNAFDNVEKLALTKSLEGYTVYILQDNGDKKSLYKILLKGKDEEIETFIQSCENIKADAKYVTLEELGTRTFFNNKTVLTDSGVMFPVQNKHDRRDKVVKLIGKLFFSDDDEYSMNRFVTEIFNNTDFARFITKDNGYIYINDDKSSIKIEDGSEVEYINNEKILEEEVTVKKNFNSALDFINNMKIFDKLYLFSAVESEGMSVFKFSTAFNGVPVRFYKDKEEEKTIIEIHVKEGSIRYFKGKLIQFAESGTDSYVSVFAHNILDSVLQNVEPDMDVNIDKIDIIYDFSKAGSYYPSWVSEYHIGKSENDRVITSTVKK